MTTTTTSTASARRISTASVGDNKSKSNHEHDSFPLVLAVAASVCLVGSAAALYFFYNHDRNHDRKGSKTNNNIDNIGDWGRRNTAKDTKDTGRGGSSNDGVDDDASFDLPQHLQRELYKEERRKASVRFLAIKKPLYENIEMYKPDGKTMLCTIGTKKANWYVRKELAVWRDIPDCHPSIRLLFEPKNSKNCKINQKKMAKLKASGSGGDTEELDNDEKMRQYNCTHKLNICVSCGAKDASESNNRDGESKESSNGNDHHADDDESPTAGLMRHYVVPYAYRKLLPTKFKTHQPHDVVLLCLDCHVEAEQAAKRQRTDVYEKLYRKDPSTRLAVVIDYDRKRLKSYAKALWQHRDKLPPERIQQYESAVREHLSKDGLEQTGSPTTTTVTTTSSSSSSSSSSSDGRIPQDVLRELALNLQPERRNPKYIPLADLVVENLCQTDEAVSKFVVSWREFFVDTLRPRHLPAGWSVHSPVQVDVDPEEESDEGQQTEEETQEKAPPPAADTAAADDIAADTAGGR